MGKKPARNRIGRKSEKQRGPKRLLEAKRGFDAELKKYRTTFDSMMAKFDQDRVEFDRSHKKWLNGYKKKLAKVDSILNRIEARAGVKS